MAYSMPSSHCECISRKYDEITIASSRLLFHSVNDNSFVNVLRHLVLYNNIVRLFIFCSPWIEKKRLEWEDVPSALDEEGNVEFHTIIIQRWDRQYVVSTAEH